MIIAELIEQLSKMDLTLTVYVETDTEISPVHSLDRDQFHEGMYDPENEMYPVLVEAILLIATEETRGAGPARVLDSESGAQGHDHPPEQ